MRPSVVSLSLMVTLWRCSLTTRCPLEMSFFNLSILSSKYRSNARKRDTPSLMHDSNMSKEQMSKTLSY